MTDFATSDFRCPRCGNMVFRCYPQTVCVGKKVNTWEYTCTKCGTVTALTVEDER